MAAKTKADLYRLIGISFGEATSAAIATTRFFCFVIWKLWCGHFVEYCFFIVPSCQHGKVVRRRHFHCCWCISTQLVSIVVRVPWFEWFPLLFAFCLNSRIIVVPVHFMFSGLSTPL